MNLIFEALKNSIQITGLVMIMMLLIEYINVKTSGRSFKKLQDSPIRQVLLSTFLGLVPGCVGGFAVVSLFTHRLVSFGALIAMMIASSGDEAFIMLAIIPKTALILFVILTVIAIIAGLLVDKFFKVPGPFGIEHYPIHTDDIHISHSHKDLKWIDNLKDFSKEKIYIIVGIAIFVLAMVSGLAGHEHAHVEEEVHKFNIFDEKWINILFTGISIVTLILTAVANKHFIKEHLWGHVVRKHFTSIFLWTFGALIFIHFGFKYLNIERWIEANSGTYFYFLLFIAIIVGLIPESGPHIVFITMFANGLAPFSILLASSIVQDGHTALPLLAESKRCFIKAKLINMGIGLLIGVAVHFMGF